MTKTSLNRIILLTSLIVFAATLFILISFTGRNAASATGFSPDDSEVSLLISSPKIPDILKFSGEEAPLNIFYVRESFDRELLVNTYWHSSTILMIKRANRWFQVIEPILKENNIPDDFKYLALIESGFTKVVSPKGAAGFWQFLEKTAREYNLEVNGYIDERYNVEKATVAACDYLNESFEHYNNWTLVAASYNAGKRRISESLKSQKANNYYDLYLNEETSRYIFRILAIKTIYENPETYGFQLNKSDLYPLIETTNLEVRSPIENLVDFAQLNGMNYRMLKELNPWIKAKSMPNSSGKKYIIKTFRN